MKYSILKSFPYIAASFDYKLMFIGVFQILIGTKLRAFPKPSPAGKGDRRAVDEESILSQNKIL